ncbi:SAM hydrolase/SAM-dependent halogenase family protein [Bacteroidetes bacterium endosymbiont of Geopemphigus sp.]|uniref:SAM hydrolase/SAM-dependent halogenase family protein n=1 Tax=Bacteroidetes bacterium endosymbiont of Geopemphigus sp. TaxID=2047937 RepID=UPI000CD209A9|nr:SAM-dependent chlorinase/fluorinase [Bacteroidetes bacterium endosymbiont of Geopemphigus sp.]
MAVITLTTDWGYKDPAVALIKGAIYNELPKAAIVDISHEIDPFDMEEAAYILKNSYKAFPKESIHIIGIDNDTRLHTRYLAAMIQGHYFLCSDNGIISLITEDYHPVKKFEINIRHPNDLSLFPEKELLVKVACHLLRGGKIELIGRRIEKLKSYRKLNPKIKENGLITGNIIYIDHFGNAVTNITRALFDKIGKKHTFEIKIRQHIFKQINNSYSGVVKNIKNESFYHGDGLALFNSANHLEIAIYKSNPRTVGDACSLLGLRRGDSIYIQFNV